MIELDLLPGFLISEDKHHFVSAEYFTKVTNGDVSKPVLAPLALQELELGVRSQKIFPHGKTTKNERAVGSFMGEICQGLNLYEIAIHPLTCKVFAAAADIREKHGLSYYDSHHAASALDFDGSIISTDKQYDRVSGLKRIDPHKI